MGLQKQLQILVKMGMFIFMSLIFLLSLENVQAMQEQVAYRMTSSELQEKFYKNQIDQKISVNIHDQSVEEALRQIANETGLKLTYRGDIITERKISLQQEEIGVSNALELILKNTALDYKFSQDGYLLITHKDKILEEIIYQETITGRVYDSRTGEPLPGVNIVLEGTQTGTTTDADGIYELTVPSLDGNLVFSYIGYETAVVPINDRTEIEVQLLQEVQSIDDLVVVGYGVQRRGDITGAISSVSPRTIEENPNITDAGQALMGRASGVDVTPAGNRPGDGVSIRIRGRRSFEAGNDPLFVIDGIPIEGGLNEINPKDIESMSVLKDASATAIYGSRGANGVIIIETRRGTPGDVIINIDSQLGINTARNLPKLYDAQGFWDYKEEAFNANGITNEAAIFEEQFRDNLENGVSYDWLDLIVRDGAVQEHNVSVSGGSEDTRFNVALGFKDDEAITPMQDFQRFTVRLNLDQVVSERFRMGVSLLNSFTERNGETYNPYGNMQSGIPNGAYNEPPLASPYDENGELKLRTSQEPDAINPLADMVDGKYVQNRQTTRVFGSVYAEYDLMDNLSIRTIFGPDIQVNRLGNFRGRFTTAAVEGDPRGDQRRAVDYGLTWENIVNYQTVFAESHNVDFTGLFSIQANRDEFSFASAEGIPIEDFQENNLGSASRMTGMDTGLVDRRLMSFMGRLNYNYESRYLLTVNARADGSSKFAEGNKWGFFPSAALSWNLTNEDFMSDQELITNLGIRVSYGETGNEGIEPFQTESVLGRVGYNWNSGETDAFGFRPIRVPNEDLSWETTATFNLGVDYEIMSGRFSGSVEFYHSKTSDLLLLRQLPFTSGYGSILTNVGVKTNQGIEFSVSAYTLAPESPGGLSWTTDFNIFTNKEKIVELAQGKVDDIGNRRFIGQPATVFYDFDKVGIWQVGQEEEARENNSMVGGVRVASTDPEDRIIVGTDVPSIITGMTNRFAYRGFDLSIVANARFGHTIQSAFHGGGIFHSGRGNHLVTDYWTEDNPNAEFPRPHAGLQQPFYGSTLRYFDGSFIKIRAINAGYDFGTEISEKLGLRSMRLFVNVSNPFVISKYVQEYHGIDPETSMDPIPQATTILGGFNISL